MMKCFSLVALSFAALLSAVTAALDERSDASQFVVDVANCYWTIPAPFCDGSCQEGSWECDRRPCGGFGYQKYCCYDSCP
ncbi:hypothetical protein DFH29DRAFT_897222, partial [Suillus ampliporus]